MDHFFTLYDIQTTPDDGAMLFGMILSIVIFGFSAAYSWATVRSKRTRFRRVDLNGDYLRAYITTIVCAGAVLELTWRTVELTIWKLDYEYGHYITLEGCVQDFNEVVQQEHDLGVDEFTLVGHKFKISDSQWRLGFHTSRHHGSPIDEGVHLRVFASGDHMLRIDVLRQSCPATSIPPGGNSSPIVAADPVPAPG
jgi:hypothetical protein